MKLRHIALSVAAASAIAAAAPSFADDVVLYPATPPVTVVPSDTPSDTTAIIVAPTPPNAVVVTPDYTYNSRTGLPNGYIVTEPGGMTPQERNDVSPNTVDRSTGAITQPGYMGPRDSKGQ